MAGGRRFGVIAALALIVIGVALLLVQFVPELQNWYRSLSFSWPMIVVGVGALLLILGLLSGAPAMAVPACIVGGIGLLLSWQERTGHWESWAYVWTLIPGFTGVGTVLAALLGGKTRRGLRGGLSLILISAVLFVIFGAFFGGLDWVGPYWPVLLIVAGLALLVYGLVARRKST